ncbi:MAG: ABC transporter permease, partial [Bryobacteraceae bacterium]
YYSTDQFLEFAGRSTIFDGVVASTISDVLWSGEGEPQRLRGNYVSNGTFAVMGVPALAGRWLGPDDYRLDAAPAAVLGYKFWQRQFGGDTGVLGRELLLNGRKRTIAGVMPRRFMWRGADVYLPIVYQRGQVTEGVRSVHVLGRLKPGVTEAQAESDLRPIVEELKRREPRQFPDKWRVGLLSFKESFPSSIRETIWILFGAVGLLLLIACANVSNLLLSRAAGRQREMAVRSSLGASRWRLVRQLLTESLLLGVAGCTLGVALAYGGLNAIIAIVPAGRIPDESEIAINTPVLFFTLGIAALTALVFGLAPALHTCRANLAGSMKTAGRGVTGGFRQAILRNGFVVAEVALSLMLLVGASLMIRTLLAMQSVELGFQADHVLTMRIPLPEQRYASPERRVVFFEELLRRLSVTPGVSAAGLNTFVHPFGNWSFPVEVVGRGRPDDQAVVIHQISPGYTRAMGIGLQQGRLFLDDEVSSRRNVALVNQTFARRYFEGDDALGRVVRVPRMRSAPLQLKEDAFQIVGVVRDTLNRNLNSDVRPELYVPYSLAGAADRLVVLAPGDPMRLANTVRHQIYAIDRDQPVTEVRTIETMMDEFVFARARFNLVLFSVFAAIGLALAVIGVYGVISSAVAQQTQEFGVRIALGASFGDIIGMVLTKGSKLLIIGIALGLVASFATTRILTQQLWSVSPFDPVSFALVSLVLLVVGIQACWWPARRAARVDPVTALRQE